MFGDAVVVHELAHRWYGDNLALEAWQHIWLKEGFATYTEWLWSEREGLGTAQEIFDDLSTIPADDPFWSLTIGDPGPNAQLDALFDTWLFTPQKPEGIEPAVAPGPNARGSQAAAGATVRRAQLLERQRR